MKSLWFLYYCNTVKNNFIVIMLLFFSKERIGQCIRFQEGLHISCRLQCSTTKRTRTIFTNVVEVFFNCANEGLSSGSLGCAVTRGSPWRRSCESRLTRVWGAIPTIDSANCIGISNIRIVLKLFPHQSL